MTRFTLAFEARSTEVPENARSPTQACELLKICWPTADRIMGLGVARGLERRTHKDLNHVEIDESELGGECLPQPARKASTARQRSFRKGHRNISDAALKISKTCLIKKAFRFFWVVPKNSADAEESFAEWYRHTISSKLDLEPRLTHSFQRRIPFLTAPGPSS